jgi:hypothetical protein
VGVGLSVENISVLNGSPITVPVLNNVTIRDIANHNNISVGAVIQALGGGAAVITRQVQ